MLFTDFALDFTLSIFLLNTFKLMHNCTSLFHFVSWGLGYTLRENTSTNRTSLNSYKTTTQYKTIKHSMKQLSNQEDSKGILCLFTFDLRACTVHSTALPTNLFKVQSNLIVLCITWDFFNNPRLTLCYSFFALSSGSNDQYNLCKQASQFSTPQWIEGYHHSPDRNIGSEGVSREWPPPLVVCSTTIPSHRRICFDLNNSICEFEAIKRGV